MRGKAPAPNQTPACCGITPAYAGKSYSLFHSTEVEQDHPRLCGEKFLIPRIAASQLGSPPPMRGKVSVSSFSIGSSRITPAYAGKSHDRRRSGCRSRDHPRLCGEKGSYEGGEAIGLGSPPPMRGKGSECSHNHPSQRITPAYAGKSSRFGCGFLRRWDHPRLCGEKLPAEGKNVDTERITPAYAGKSPVTEQEVQNGEDHPRLCGEKLSSLSSIFAPQGSPPPMRGKEN